MSSPQIGQKVKCNGYEGVIVFVHVGQLAGMVDVRLPGGVCCIGYSSVVAL